MAPLSLLPPIHFSLLADFLCQREKEFAFPLNLKVASLIKWITQLYAGIIETSHLSSVFPFPPHRTPAHSRSLSLFLRWSVLFNSPFFSVAHRRGRRINQKSFEGEAEVRRRRDRGEKRRKRAKSIPQVNLRPGIFYTINKQGESGDWMREGTVGGGRLQRTLQPAAAWRCLKTRDSPHHRKILLFFKKKKTPTFLIYLSSIM